MWSIVFCKLRDSGYCLMGNAFSLSKFEDFVTGIRPVKVIHRNNSKTFLADTPNSGHLLYSRQCAMYQVLFPFILKKPPISGHLLTLNSGHFVLHQHYHFNRKRPPNSGYSN